MSQISLFVLLRKYQRIYFEDQHSLGPTGAPQSNANFWQFREHRLVLKSYVATPKLHKNSVLFGHLLSWQHQRCCPRRGQVKTTQTKQKGVVLANSEKKINQWELCFKLLVLFHIAFQVGRKKAGKKKRKREEERGQNKERMKERERDGQKKRGEIFKNN